MTIIDFTEGHVAQAMRLAQAEYDKERSLVPALPAAQVPDLQSFAKSGLCVAAFEGGSMLGFLCAYGPFKNAFGTPVKGIWSPAHAHAAIGDKTRVYHRMYQAAAEKWVAAGALSHAIALYAHDDAAKQAWFTYGFGLRCIDAIKPIDANEVAGDFCEMEGCELKELHIALNSHMKNAPCFMNRRYVKKKNTRLFAAKREGKAVAFLELRESGENFACGAADMMNICGAYTVPEMRGTGLSADLLHYTKAVLAKEGYTRLGVDFESFNPTALGFWLKHFTAYTNSVVRRIDEKGNM